MCDFHAVKYTICSLSLFYGVRVGLGLVYKCNLLYSLIFPWFLYIRCPGVND